MYPPGFATTVSVAGLREPLEGAARGPAHFDAVATVVAKLLNIVAPQVAYFGQKDAQQALVIARMARDLDIPARIEVCPTVREADGLARSSRNAYLDAAQREQASAIPAALRAVAAAIGAGERDGALAAAAGLDELRRRGVEPEYLARRRPPDARAGRARRAVPSSSPSPPASAVPASSTTSSRQPATSEEPTACPPRPRPTRAPTPAGCR